MSTDTRGTGALGLALAPPAEISGHEPASSPSLSTSPPAETERTVEPVTPPRPPPIFVRSATGDVPRVSQFEDAADVVTPVHNKRVSVSFEPMPSTPVRGNGNGDVPAPGSPLRPLDSEPPSSTARARTSRPPSWHRMSLEVPMYPSYLPSSPSSSMSAGSPDSVFFSPASTPTTPPRFEPTPGHGLHTRNLSVHFPHPGARRPPPSPGSPAQAAESVIPDADRSVFGSQGEWGDAEVKRGKRRGHHHKHSLSHNFFSFLDPTQTNPNPTSPASASTDDFKSPASDRPTPVPMPFTPSSTTLAPLPPRKRDPQTQLLASVGIIEAAIGTGLWVEGQMSGWRCLTAVGYLVVFDAMGLWVAMVARSEREGGSSLRRPFGSSRLTSLLCFAQSLFLLFAAVYNAKEAVEQVVLGGHEHGGHDHGHSHGDHTREERAFPHILLLLATAASAFSGAVLQNHSRLVDATGPLFLSPSFLALPGVRSSPVFANPFSLSVAGTAAVLLVGSFLTPSLDAIASVVLTVLTAKLSYTPTVTFARVLLQTAPSAASTQMRALRRALRDVSEDRRVLGLGTLRCWAITGKRVTDSGGPPSAPPSRRGSVSTVSPSTQAFTSFSTPSPAGSGAVASSPSPRGSPRGNPASLSGPVGLNGLTAINTALLSPTRGPVSGGINTHAPLVVTLVVHVHPDATDRDVLDITRASWCKLSTAVNGHTVGESEVSVQVRRGWDGAE